MTSLPTFIAAVVLISASPGPAMALIVRRAALRGFGAAVPTVLGLEAGLYVWALLAGAGLAALVAASEVAFLTLRIVGAGVLVLLGLRAWRAAWRDGDGAAAADAGADRPGRARGWRAFGEGAVVQLANPKAAVFMMAFYPQFVPADRPLFATTARARAAAGGPGDGAVPRCRGRSGPGRRLVPAPADTPPARGRQRRSADRPGTAGGDHQPPSRA